MEVCERLVDTWLATQRDDEIATLVQGIIKGNITLLNIVKCLGKLLTSDDAAERGKGVSLLSAVVKRCPPERLDKQTTRVLVSFFVQKLEESDSVIPALEGLLPLANLSHFLSTEVTEVFRAIVAHVTMRAHVQSTRYIVWRILDTMVAQHRDVLRKMGAEFIRGYTSLAEGEKDPRNLLIAFSIDRVLLIEFDIAQHIEDMFDITFCYFPITFKPPPDDPYGISSDDLKSGLRACLNATPLFGSLGIPLFLEKLSASTSAVKRDALQAMTACLPVYGPGVTARYATTIWEAVKVEILQPIDSETEDAALETARTLVSTLYPETQVSTDGILNEMCTACLKVLEEPEKNQAKHVTKIFATLIKATEPVRRVATSSVVPHLIHLFSRPDEAAYRVHVLQGLITILLALREVDERTEMPQTTEDNTPLSPFKDEILSVLLSGMKADETRKTSLDAVLQVIQLHGLLDTTEMELVVSQVNELLEASEGHEALRDPILSILMSISRTTPTIIEQLTLPLLFSALPDQAPATQDAPGRARYQRTLRFLSSLCLQPDLFETLVVRLSTKLELVSSTVSRFSETTPDGDVTTLVEHNAAYLHAILVALDTTLEAKVAAKHTDVVKYIDRLVPRLYRIFVEEATLPNAMNVVGKDSRVLKVASSIISVIARCLSVERQNEILAILVPAYHSGDFSKVVNQQLNEVPALPCGPLEPEASVSQQNLVVLFAAPIVSTRREVSLPINDLPQFTKDMVHWAIQQAKNEAPMTAAFQIAATILNKHLELLLPQLTDWFEVLWSDSIVSASADVDKRKRAVHAWTWLTRALLVRNHPSGFESVDRLFSLFSDANLGVDAAKAIGALASEDSVFTKANFAVIKLLHDQKYATKVLPKILTQYKEVDDELRKTPYLIALAMLIKHLPKSIYAHAVSSLMPLFILGLHLPEADMRANVIEALLTIAADKSDDTALADHASTVISELLKNSFPSETSSTRLRVAALRCLGILPNAVRYTVLHPHKPDVLKQLGKALDDPKREVRRAAVDTRTIWYMIRG